MFASYVSNDSQTSNWQTVLCQSIRFNLTIQNYLNFINITMPLSRHTVEFYLKFSTLKFIPFFYKKKRSFKSLKRCISFHFKWNLLAMFVLRDKCLPYHGVHTYIPFSILLNSFEAKIG